MKQFEDKYLGFAPIKGVKIIWLYCDQLTVHFPRK